jgi:alpha-mannosidase
MSGSRRAFLKTTVSGIGLAWADVRSLSARPTDTASFPRPNDDVRDVAHEDPAVVWRIGEFNYSSGEFDDGVDPLTDDVTVDYLTQNPVYIIGQSTWEDWLAFQPGSRNTSAGYRPHPFTIQFRLADVPRGLCTLKVAMLVEHTNVSHLEVDLNGHRGWFYFHPVLNYAMGDIASAFVPQYASDTINIPLPTHFLKEGLNQLVLTALDDDNESIASGDHKGLNSGIVYDALQLEHEPTRELAVSAISVQMVPSIFYRMKHGHLEEIVEAFVRFNQSAPGAEVTLTSENWQFTQQLGPDRDFGEYKAEFAVPAFDAPVKAQVRVSANGSSKTMLTTLVPGKRWNIFVLPSIHLDIGFTDDQSKVAEVHSHNIDKALEVLREHPSFRFSLDGTWIAEEFLRGRSHAQHQRFAQSVREKKMLLPAQYANLLTGLATGETLIRSLCRGYRCHAKYGGTFDYANITDVPSYTWSYPSILAAAGLKYLVAGSNNHDAPILLIGRLHEKSPFWWEGPDGRRVLMWYSRAYAQATALFGMPPRIDCGRDSLPLFLQIYTRPEYSSDGVIVYGTQGDNADLDSRQATFVNQWNAIYAYPKLRFSGVSEALEYIADQAGASIPTFRGDGGPYWEEGVASDSKHVAAARENEHRALSAEKAATISSLIDPRVRPDPEALKRIWENLILFDEHTWGYSLSVGDPEIVESRVQLATKDSRTKEGKRLVDYILRRSLAAIANFVPQPSRTVIVFNLLNWSRSGLVEIDLRKDMQLVDLVTKEKVTYETLWDDRTYRHIRFLASEIPGMGYKCYKVSQLEHAHNIDGTPPVGWSYWSRPKNSSLLGCPPSTAPLESPYYRIVLDPERGSIRSVFDKELDRELVDAGGAFRFNEYLYVTGGDKVPNRLIRFPNSAPMPSLKVEGGHGGRLIGVTKESFGTVARLECSATNTPRVSTEIILFDRMKKIEFINHVHKRRVFHKEAVYFVFPFAMDRPQFLYDIQAGYVNPAQDQLPGAGKEWFPVQHWVAVRQDGVTAAIVPLDAPLVTLGDILRGTWAAEFGVRQGTVFSFVMNNYWEDNYAASQEGSFNFRYVLTSASNLQPAELSRLGWDEMTPLETNEILANEKVEAVPGSPRHVSDTFLEVNAQNVILTAWKPSEDGNGSILRFVEVAGRSDSVTLNTSLLNIQAAWLCDAVERPIRSLPTSSRSLDLKIGPFEIVTLRLQASAVNASV